jgi:hypothetical protein
VKKRKKIEKQVELNRRRKIDRQGERRSDIKTMNG